LYPPLRGHAREIFCDSAAGVTVKKVGIVQDPIFIEHNPGSWHPESPQRLLSIYEMLRKSELVELLHQVRPRKAERKEIELIHTPRYFDQIAATAGRRGTYLDPDTVTSERSFDAALTAAGGVLAGIDRIMAGCRDESGNVADREVDRGLAGREVAEKEPPGAVFALVRPPGHHAEADRARGFCLFNNIAIGAMYAMEAYGLERVLIVDWDLHHGNGTQHSFEADPRVLYFSTHQYPYYPGTGSMTEVGTGKGRGFTINVPLPAGYGDEEYLAIYRTILTPVADQYRPQLVLVSAGFDIYHADPLGGMRVTIDGFTVLTRLISSVARAHADGRMLLTLEGGYHIIGQTRSIEAIIRLLAGAFPKVEDHADEDTGFRRGIQYGPGVVQIIESVLSFQKEFWSCF
jgi:acetoin utilization deacetylase AcuC-like enzyme